MPSIFILFFMEIDAPTNRLVCQLISSRPISSFKQLVTNFLMIVAVLAYVVKVDRHHGVTSTRFTPFGAVTPFQIALA